MCIRDRCNGHSVVAGDKVPVDVPLIILVGNGMRSETDSVDYIDPSSNDTEAPIETGGGDEDEFEEVTAPPVEEHPTPTRPEEEKKDKKEKSEPSKNQP